MRNKSAPFNLLMGIEIRAFLVVEAFSQILGTRFAENG